MKKCLTPLLFIIFFSFTMNTSFVQAENDFGPVENVEIETGTRYIYLSWDYMDQAQEYKVEVKKDEEVKKDKTALYEYVTIEELEPGQEYQITIWPKDEEGEKGEKWQEKIKTDQAPAGPELEKELKNNELTLTWEVENEDPEKVYIYENDFIKDILAGGQEKYKTGLVPGQEYQFYITYIDDEGETSEKSNNIEVTSSCSYEVKDTGEILARITDYIEVTEPFIISFIAVLFVGRLLLLIPFWFRKF